MKDELQIHLVERIQASDSSAEDELFIQYKDPIHWKVYRHIKTGEESIKDVVSDIYMAILEGLRKESFEPERWQSLDAFIWGVTQNKIRGWFKKNKVEAKVFSSDSPSERKGESENVTEDRVENKELRNLLRKALRQLKAEYKEVLDLRYFRELSIQQISEKLGIAPRRVSERIHSALKLMRKACKKEKDLSIFGVIFLLY